MNAQDFITRLDLAPHPEGGWYREVHRSARSLPPFAPYSGQRDALTAIYFLLETGDFSAFHTVKSEEVWIHLAGAPLELALIANDQAQVQTLDAADLGGTPLFVVPPDVLQAARSLGDFTLVTCLVAPGFSFEDFSMPGREDLLSRFPEHAALIRRFTRG